MIGIEQYRERFSERSWRVFDHAVSEAVCRGQNRVSVEHIADALAGEEPEIFAALLRDLELDPRTVRDALTESLEKCPAYEGPGIRIAPETIRLLRWARERARGKRRQRIEAIDMFVALAQIPEGVFIEILSDSRASFEAAISTLDEIESILQSVRARALQGEKMFALGEMIRITGGPFQCHIASIEAIEAESAMLRVTLTIFGKPTPVWIEFRHVDKIGWPRAA